VIYISGVGSCGIYPFCPAASVKTSDIRLCGGVAIALIKMQINRSTADHSLRVATVASSLTRSVNRHFSSQAGDTRAINGRHKLAPAKRTPSCFTQTDAVQYFFSISWSSC